MILLAPIFRIIYGSNVAGKIAEAIKSTGGDDRNALYQLYVQGSGLTTILDGDRFLTDSYDFRF